MLLNSTRCRCGKDLRGVKFEHYTPRRFDDKFYGGRISMEGEMTCECGRKLKGYFEKAYRMGSTEQYELVDLEILEDVPEVINDTTEVEKIDLNESSSEEILTFDENEPKYEEMTYMELKSIAKSKGIKGNLKREEIIRGLRGE